MYSSTREGLRGSSVKASHAGLDLRREPLLGHPLKPQAPAWLAQRESLWAWKSMLSQKGPGWSAGTRRETAAASGEAM